MLFNSLDFLVFFPIVTALYFVLPLRPRWHVVLAASALFYMAFVPAYILILGFTIVVDYFAGLLVESAKGTRRRLYLSMSLVANVGVLAVFKYYAFLDENVSSVLGAFGVKNPIPALRIALPIGLSFHTFQAMSYTIEVFRGNQKAERSFWRYALYVMFYPQLVAGPIERPQNVLWQFERDFRFDYARVASGLRLMAWGMFKKVVIADRIASEVDVVYGNPTHYQGLALVIATAFFAMQIYCDFSGYSDIALGSAEVMGVKLMKNFDTPYFSTSLGEFWRRWHISLSTWFRDYLYIPLGGSRVPRLLRYRNLLAVFLVSGLWHGASWTYVVWGAIHGAFLVIEDATKGARGRISRAVGLEGTRVAKVLGWLVTLTVVCVAWVYFRARSIGEATYIVSHMPVGLGKDLAALVHGELPVPVPMTFWLGVATLSFEEIARRRGGPMSLIASKPFFVRYATYFAVVYTALLTASGETQFIYFQF